MTQPKLVTIGLDPDTAIGAAVAARGGSRLETWAPPTGVDAGTSAVFVGAGCDDPVARAHEAVGAGLAILFEPIGCCSSTALAELSAAAREAGVPAVAAFRRRWEPALAIMAERVRTGSIGLTFAVQAEALASHAPDVATELLDLLDALAECVALDPQRLDRSSAPSERAAGSDVLSARLASEASALIGVRRRAPGDAGAAAPVDELASVRLMGSHGTLTADFEAPALEVRSDLGPRPGRDVRIHARAADVLVERFMASVQGSAERLATLERAATLAATPGWEAGPGSDTT